MSTATDKCFHLLPYPMAGRRALFINFHGLGEPRRQLLPGEEAFWLPREILDVWLAQAAQYPQVQITFDDGNVSDFEIALPCLKARGITAQFFVCAGHLDHPGHLAVGQLRELAAAGMGIGNHGMFHRDWRSLDDPTLLQEIVDARDRLENLIGRKISRAACPFGSYDRRVLRALRQAGYERVYTSDGGWAKAKNWIYPRNSVCRSDSGAVVDHLLREKPIGFAASVRWLKRTVKRLR